MGSRRDRVERVVLLEVKSGKSSDLTKRQRGVRRVVRSGNVEFEILRLRDLSLGVPNPVS